MSDISDLSGKPAEEAIPILLDRYGNKLYRLGIRECGDEDAALDLLQDTFIAAFRNWRQFEGRSSPSSWLYTIAVRGCQRRRRRRAGEPNRLASLAELLPAAEQDIALLPAAESPHAKLIRKETQAAVERAIARLPQAYRLPLILKEIEELPVAEVAQILGLKEATVKTRLHRARLQLRRELKAVLPRASRAEGSHGHQICLDLLQAKQEALDRGVEFRVDSAELCSRCAALLETLDATHDACVELGRDKMPPAVRELLQSRLKRSTSAHG